MTQRNLIKHKIIKDNLDYLLTASMADVMDTLGLTRSEAAAYKHHAKKLNGTNKSINSIKPEINNEIRIRILTTKPIKKSAYEQYKISIPERSWVIKSKQEQDDLMQLFPNLRIRKPTDTQPLDIDIDEVDKTQPNLSTNVWLYSYAIKINKLRREAKRVERPYRKL